jgi:Protein of unknown function (DUF3047)
MSDSDLETSMQRRFAGVLACLLSVAAGCADQARQPGADPAGSLSPYPVFTAADALDRPWLHFRVWRETDWRLAALDDEVVISATGQSSASGLGRWVEIDTATCPAIEWSWRVDALPEGADLAVRDRDDVAASLFLAFGDPGSMTSPKPVPTVRYAWSAAANPVGAVIDSPFLPGTLRTLVVRSGRDALGPWATERRDLREDYRMAFGAPPAEPIQVFALFTDNDHLKAPTRAYYRSASVLCTDAPEDMMQ